MDYADLMNPENRDAALLRFLQHLERFGVAFLRNVPTADHRQVEKVAERFGPIRETFYGRSWDVKSVPNAKNIAYTSLFLDLHMDLMYFEAPPGLQFLHCLENSVTGGESLFLDIFNAVQILKQRDPAAYHCLSTTPVTFHYINSGHRMRFRRRTIEDDHPNEPLLVYYSPPFQGPVECEPDQMQEFYRSFKVLDGIINDPKLLYKVKLLPGDCAVFANRRALHGRTSFDTNSGNRHLKGTYVDSDVFRDRLMHLEYVHRQ